LPLSRECLDRRVLRHDDRLPSLPCCLTAGLAYPGIVPPSRRSARITRHSRSRRCRHCMASRQRGRTGNRPFDLDAERLERRLPRVPLPHGRKKPPFCVPTGFSLEGFLGRPRRRAPAATIAARRGSNDNLRNPRRFMAFSRPASRDGIRSCAANMMGGTAWSCRVLAEISKPVFFRPIRNDAFIARIAIRMRRIFFRRRGVRYFLHHELTKGTRSG